MGRAKEKRPSGTDYEGRFQKDQGTNRFLAPNYESPINAVQQAASMPAAAVVAELQRYAAAMGLTLTARCRRCGAPLWASESLHAKLGPVCRKRVA